jgi:hypothetical protein
VAVPSVVLTATGVETVGGHVSGGTFRLSLLNSDSEVACPNCEYPFWVRLVEVVARCAVVCPVCRCRIWLHDADGSVQNAATELQDAVDDLMLTLGGMFK